MATPRIPVHHAQELPIGGKLPSYFILKSLTQSFPLEWRDVLRYQRLRKLHADLHAANCAPLRDPFGADPARLLVRGLSRQQVMARAARHRESDAASRRAYVWADATPRFGGTSEGLALLIVFYQRCFGEPGLRTRSDSPCRVCQIWILDGDDGLANREAFRWRFQKRTGESRRRASYSTTMSLPDTDTVPHHCKIAGRADTLFCLMDAIALIHNASRGHPRAVNNLALLLRWTAAFGYRSRHRRRGRGRRTASTR